MVATGLLAIGEWGTGDADKEKMLTDIVADQVDVVTRGFLGLTVACARCHDHKFDPISRPITTGLAGIFFSTQILARPRRPRRPVRRCSGRPLATKARRQERRPTITRRRSPRRMARWSTTTRKHRARGSSRPPCERGPAPSAPRGCSPFDRPRIDLARCLRPLATDLPRFVVRKWANVLCGDQARLRQAPEQSDDRPSRGSPKDVHFWAGESDPPWVGGERVGRPGRDRLTLILAPAYGEPPPRPEESRRDPLEKPDRMAPSSVSRPGQPTPTPTAATAWPLARSRAVDGDPPASWRRATIDNGGSAVVSKATTVVSVEIRRAILRSN